jgi:dTDP-4-amino-4,6-dideoxygalactose transaminase
LGDAAAFSFCQDKIISTGGEGGMLVTNDRQVWEKAWSYKDHGKSFDAVYNREHAPGFRWLHHSIGTNWRMTEVQAAIGRKQLSKLGDWHLRRNRNAAILSQHFQNVPALRVLEPPAEVGHAYYKYDVFLRPKALKDNWSRDRIMSEINSRGVPCFSGSCSEVYLEKAFDAEDVRPRKRLPVARELGATGLTFLVHPTLGDEDMEEVCGVVKKVLQEATKSQPIPIFSEQYNRKGLVQKVTNHYLQK